MKKLLTLTLAVILILSLGTVAFASQFEGSVSPDAVLLINADTGEILYSKNENESAYSSGLVKLMTAYATVKNVDNLDSVVTVSSSSLSSLGSLDITLYPKLSGGEQTTVRSLLYGMLIASANDAALVLADYVGGSTENFVNLMNQYAAELNMTGTVYTNPTGKHYGGQYTTAADIAILAAELLKYKDLTDIFSSVYYTIPETNLSASRELINTNRLLCEYSDTGSTLYTNATGMISGYTSYSGGCLAATAQKDGTNLICIILGDYSDGRTERWSLAAELFDFGFEQTTTVLASDILADIPLSYTDSMGNEYTVTPNFTDVLVNVSSADGITAAVTSSDNISGIAVYTDSDGNIIANVPVTLTANAPAISDDITTDNTPNEIQPDTAVPDNNIESPSEKDSNSLLAVILSAAVLLLAFISAFFTVKAKNKNHRSSGSDSFRIRFRQNFMTWLLFGVIVVAVIVVICIVIM